MSAWRHRGKRWLYLIHRWIGIVSCLLLAMWFCSGVVMMYVPYPSLTPAERIDGLADIDWSQVRGAPAQSTASTALLEQGQGGPVWRVRDDGGERGVSATSGVAQGPTDEIAAARTAAAFGRAGVRSVARIDNDQWTVAGGYDRFRPLWKVALDTPDDRVLYIASTTGAVVQDTRGRERFWNWLGAVPHWLYPTILRQDQPLWRQVVLWTAGIGVVGAVSGMWIGILRVRFRQRYRGGRVTPYRGWQWWHHILGLVGGTLLTTWIVSGWLSVDPGRWFASEGLSDAARTAYARPGAMPAVNWARLATKPASHTARRLRIVWADGRAVLVIERASAARVVLNAVTLQPVHFDAGQLAAHARMLLPDQPVRAVERLDRPDNYWYEAKGVVELPVLRVKFADPARTWVHISIATGEIVGDMDARRRAYRWVYDGLHRWDFDGLITRRPLWDLWMWLWSIAGGIVSVSGVVIGWRRLFPVRKDRHVQTA